MSTTIKKIVIWIYNLLFFVGYFYIIFINFMSPPNISTRPELIMTFVLSLTIAIMLPGIICWQGHYIRQLEAVLEEEDDIEESGIR